VIYQIVHFKFHLENIQPLRVTNKIANKTLIIPYKGCTNPCFRFTINIHIWVKLIIFTFLLQIRLGLNKGVVQNKVDMAVVGLEQ